MCVCVCVSLGPDSALMNVSCNSVSTLSFSKRAQVFCASVLCKCLIKVRTIRVRDTCGKRHLLRIA